MFSSGTHMPHCTCGGQKENSGQSSPPCLRHGLFVVLCGIGQVDWPQVARHAPASTSCLGVGVLESGLGPASGEFRGSSVGPHALAQVAC